MNIKELLTQKATPHSTMVTITFPNPNLTESNTADFMPWQNEDGTVFLSGVNPITGEIQDCHYYRKFRERIEHQDEVEVLDHGYLKHKNSYAKINEITEIPRNKQEDMLNNMKQLEERKKEIEAFHKILDDLGIEFDIDFAYYKEEADYMNVKLNGKIIFSGKTDDLVKDEQ